MIENPLTIEKDTFFICGPIQTNAGLPINPDYKKYEDLLIAKNYKVFNPETNVHCKDVVKRIDFMVMCDKVITLPGYESCALAQKEIKIARELNKEIILAEGFPRWELRKQQSNQF